MMKCLVLLVSVHLSVVLSLRDANSHPLLFESKKDRMSTVHQSVVDSGKEDLRNTVKYSKGKLQDIGYATNCGNPDHNFTLTWDPKVVNPSRGVVFHLDMVVVSKFVMGTVNISVYTGGSSEAFISQILPLNCGLIHQKFPDVKCPMDKGDVVKMSYSQPDLTALPPGTYKLKADVKDQDKKDFLCAELTIEIQE